MGLITAHERMANDKLRQAIALEAARLMYERTESEYYSAKRKAAKRLCRRQCKPEDLPSNAEIREQIQVFARIHEGAKRDQHLRAMRLDALRLMRLLRAFRPRLIGSVMTGHVRQGSDIDIHVFSNSVGLIVDLLKNEGFQFDVERKQIVKFAEARVFTHIHVHDRFNYELTVYAEDKVHYIFRSSITGKAIERASIRELEDLLEREYPGVDLQEELKGSVERIDPYLTFRMLLLPLEDTKQSGRYHPEGDVLFHSLQVFELARDSRPYDEEFLLAALLHDVGKGIDPTDHVGAGVSALEGVITDRTRFLIEHHMHAHEIRAGTAPIKLRQSLARSPDYDDLLLLSELDEKGRQQGIPTLSLDEALDYVKELERQNG
jgi:hypothetical protein